MTEVDVAKQSGIKKGENYASWKAPYLTPDQFHSISEEERLNYLILCSSLAPSTHNTQPWAFNPDPLSNQIEIYLDKGRYYKDANDYKDLRRVLPASDVKGRQACISIGCAISNFMVAARYFNLKPALTLQDINPEAIKPLLDPEVSDPRRYIPIACVKLLTDTDSQLDRETFEAIFTRRMNRGKYEPSYAISDEILKSLKDISLKNGVTTHLLTRLKLADRVRISPIADFQRQADTFVANNETFTRELGDWLLPNDTQSYLGMPGDTFGLPDEQSLYFHRGMLGEVNLRADEKEGFARSGQEGINSSFAVGIITVKQDSPENWVKTGITLGETSLLLEKNQIAMAVHAGLAEVDFVRNILAASVFSKQKPTMLFRAGYTREKRPHSPRLLVDEIRV